MASGFAAPKKITPELATFFNVDQDTEMSPVEVTKGVIKYIKDNNLTNENGVIQLDEKLKFIIPPVEKRQHIIDSLYNKKRDRFTQNPYNFMGNGEKALFKKDEDLLADGDEDPVGNCSDPDCVHTDCSMGESCYFRYTLTDDTCGVLGVPCGSVLSEHEIVEILENDEDKFSKLYGSIEERRAQYEKKNTTKSNTDVKFSTLQYYLQGHIISPNAR